MPFDQQRTYHKRKAVQENVAQSAAHVVGFLGTKLFLYPISIATGILVARALGPTDRGIYSFLVLFDLIFVPLLSLGFGQGVIYYISNKMYHPRDVVVSCMIIGCIQGGVTAILITVAWSLDLLGRTVAQTPNYIIFSMILLLPVKCSVTSINQILFGTSRFHVMNAISVAYSILGLLLLWGFVILNAQGLDGMIIVAWLNVLLLYPFILYFIWRNYRPKWFLNINFISHSYKYGIKAWIGNVFLEVSLRMDQFILGAFMHPSILGQYTIAVSMSELLWVIPGALGPVLLTKVSREKDLPNTTTLVNKVHRLTTLIVGVLAVFTVSLGWYFIPVIFGKPFAPASEMLIFLIPGTVAMVTPKILSKYFSGLGKPEFATYCSITGGISGIIFYIILVPLWGGVGAAIGSSCSYFLTAAVAIYLYKEIIKPSKAELFSYQSLDFIWVWNQFIVIILKNSRRILDTIRMVFSPSVKK